MYICKYLLVFPTSAAPPVLQTGGGGPGLSTGRGAHHSWGGEAAPTTRGGAVHYPGCDSRITAGRQSLKPSFALRVSKSCLYQSRYSTSKQMYYFSIAARQHALPGNTAKRQ